jgi:hypothetical protein
MTTTARTDGVRQMRLVGVVACAAALAIPHAERGTAAVDRPAGCPPPVAPPSVQTILRPRWLTDVLITEYFPAPESWFNGRRVGAPGLAGVHRIDWLYSARGLAMQGEGIGTDGRLYHFAGPYSLTWRNADGAPTYPCARVPGVWTNAAPAWIGPTPLNRAIRAPTRFQTARGRTGRPRGSRAHRRRPSSRRVHRSVSPTGTTPLSTRG